jgi:hypothetical protein
MSYKTVHYNKNKNKSKFENTKKEIIGKIEINREIERKREMEELRIFGQKKKYLQNNNRSITLHDTFLCNRLSLIYFDNTNHEELLKLLYSDYLIMITVPIDPMKMLVGKWYTLYCAYIVFIYGRTQDSPQEYLPKFRNFISDYNNIINFSNEFKKKKDYDKIPFRDKDIVNTFIYRYNEQKYNIHIDEFIESDPYKNSDDNSNNDINSNVRSNDVLHKNFISIKYTEHIYNTLKYVYERHIILFNNFIDDIKKSVEYNYKRKSGKYVNNNQNNSMEYNMKYLDILRKNKTTCMVNRKYFYIAIDIIAEKIMSNKIDIMTDDDIQKIINICLSKIDKTYVKFHIENIIPIIIYYLIYKKHIHYNSYVKICKERQKYMYDESFKIFKNNYMKIINCWYDSLVRQIDSKYYIIYKYNNINNNNNNENNNINSNNPACYIIKEQFMKALKYTSENIKFTKDTYKIEEVFDTKKAQPDIIRDMFENIEELYNQFCNNVKDLDTVKDMLLALKNTKESTYEYNDEQVREYLINQYDTVKDYNKNKNTEKFTIKNTKKYELLTKLHKEMGHNFNEMDNVKDTDRKDLLSKTGAELCKTWLFTYTDIKENYGKIFYPEQKKYTIKESCFDTIGKDMNIEMIHPKFYYYKIIDTKTYQNEKGENNFHEKLIAYYDKKEYDHPINHYELAAHQKQGVFGLTPDASDFRKCHYLYFMGFRYFYRLRNNNNKNELDNYGNTIVENYDYRTNKILNYCMSNRNNLFPVRYTNTGKLPWHKMSDNPNSERDFIDMLNSDKVIFLGVLHKKLKGTKTYIIDSSVQLFIFYDKSIGGIYTFDHNLNLVMENMIGAPITFTYMELNQLCNYMKLYAYSYDYDINQTYVPNEKVRHDVYFSKYDIFNINEKYDENIYLPLTKNEFDEVLKHMRTRLKKIKCFSYPPLINVPKCYINKINEIDKLNVTSNDSDLSCIAPQIFMVEYPKYNKEECNIKRYMSNNPGAYDNKKGGFIDIIEFKLQMKKNINYFYKHQDKIDEYYKMCNRIQKQYGNNSVDITYKGYMHELLNGRSKNWWTNATRDFDVRKHIFQENNILVENDMFFLKYKPIEPDFVYVYEIIDYYKFNKLINTNDARISEISNTCVYIESAISYFKNNDTDGSHNIIYDIYTPDQYYIGNLADKISNIIKTYNINQQKIKMYEIVKFPHKYDLFILSNKFNYIYTRSPYSIPNDNKIKIFYLLIAILNLKKNGNIIMQYNILRSYAQRDIFYLFKKIFQHVELYIPQCSYVLPSTSGFIIGFNYINQLNDNTIEKFLQILSNINDNRYIEFPKIFHDLNVPGNFNFIVPIEKKSDMTEEWIYSFVNLEDNELYEYELNNYFNEYYNRVNKSFSLMWLHIKYPENEIYEKLKIALKWAIKHKLEISFNLDINKFDNQFESYILNKLTKYKYIAINFDKYSSTRRNKKITLDNIINDNEKYIYTINYVKNINPQVYRYVSNNLYPHDTLYKYFNITVDQKYLKEDWFLLCELLIMYDLLNDSSKTYNIYTDKNIKIYRSVLNYYTKNKFNVRYELTNIYSDNMDLLVINSKQNFAINMENISNYKGNIIMRLPMGLLNDKNVIDIIINKINCYKFVYFHKSEIESNKIYMILKSYNTINRDIENTLQTFYNIYDKIIKILINVELGKLFFIYKIDTINKNTELNKKLKEINSASIYKYLNLFMN